MSIGHVYFEHADDIEKYLRSKLPDLPEHTAMEIGAYIGQKTAILVQDCIAEYDRFNKMMVKRYSRKNVKESEEKV